MSSPLQSKAVVASVIAFVGLFGVIAFRVVARRQARVNTPLPVAIAAPVKPTDGTSSLSPAIAPLSGGPANPTPRETTGVGRLVAENAAYLDQVYNIDRRSREDQDAHGIPVTRRPASGGVGDWARDGESTPTAADNAAVVPAAPPIRTTSRLQGRPATIGPANAARDTTEAVPIRSGPVLPVKTDLAARTSRAASTPTASERAQPQRFNPYGGVLKCELVFPLDSVNEEMPLIGLVMEPVYNNGRLVIPAGTEVHGTARPDRQRNRLFSGQQWVFVFPREHGRINGRQLSVRGVALERSEPDVNGMTWGLSDGSYGIEGTIIRSMNNEEIKRFVATFLAGTAAGMQTKQTNANGGEAIDATPRNALLQGLSADMQQVAADIAAEVAQHGVFIHIPAGHQFYLYPTQIIDPDAADVSSDIATVQ